VWTAYWLVMLGTLHGGLSPTVSLLLGFVLAVIAVVRFRWLRSILSSVGLVLGISSIRR
jgi:hypothetical protein